MARKAALDNMPVACCNRRGFPAGKRVHFGPPLLNTSNKSKAQRSGFWFERRNKDTVEVWNFDFKSQVVDLVSTIWGFSSAGRAPALQAGGQRFDPANLHQEIDWSSLEIRNFIEFLEKEIQNAPWKLNIDDYDAIMRRQHKGKFFNWVKYNFS